MTDNDIVISVAGATGPAGTQIRFGTVNPTTEGVNGDFYINTTTNWLFGPKAAGVWPGTYISLVGPPGGAVAIRYTFSSTTADADPGPGLLRLSNATQNASTVIRADLLDMLGTDWTAPLGTLADSTNAVKGYIRIVKTFDVSKWLLFTVSALASPSGYKNITVANVGSSAASPFTTGDDITLVFDRVGDMGPVQSVAGRTGVVTLTKSDVGLSNVDNTTDAGKPVSTAQQTALDLKANLAGPTFTGTVNGITKSMVGLGSVDNTADTAKPVSTAQQTALDLKANLASPTLTGTPAAPTAAVGTNTTQVATTAYVIASRYTDRTTVAGSSVASVTMSSIPATLRSLEVRWSARSAVAAQFDTLSFQIGGDTGSLYTYIFSQANNGAWSTSNAALTTSCYAGYTSAASAPAANFAAGIIVFPSWDIHAGCLAYTASSTNAGSAAADIRCTATGGTYTGVASRVSIKFFAAGGNLAIGSDFQIIGQY